MASEETLLRTLLVVAAILLVPLLTMAIVMSTRGLWGHTGGSPGGGWAWLLPWLVMLAAVIGFGILGYGALRRSAGSTTDPTPEIDPALEELRLAYARGGFSDEEFEERRGRLQLMR